MNKSQCKYSIVLGVVAALLSTGAHSQNKEKLTDDFEYGPIEIVKGTEPMSEARKAWMASDDFAKSMAKDKEVARLHRNAMSEHGYITVSDDEIARQDTYMRQRGKSKFTDVKPLLAYDPVAQHLGLKVIGVIPDPPLEDGMIHDTTTVLKHPTLGKIMIRERSIATEPRTTSKYIYSPKFDMSVNGNPALMSVFKTKNGKRGRTVLSILTQTQLLHVSVSKAITKDDDLYDDLMNLAQRL